MTRNEHIGEAEALVTEIDAYRLGDLNMPDGMTVSEQLRLAELHLALADAVVNKTR